MLFGLTVRVMTSLQTLDSVKALNDCMSLILDSSSILDA